MKDLKIKIGEISTSPPSAIVFIPVPLTGITPEVFSKIRSAKEKKIEQLVIPQMAPQSFEDYNKVLTFMESKTCMI